MEVYIDQAVNWILTLSPTSIYTIFLFVAYAENILPPIPGDLLIVFGGYLAAEQIISFNGLLMITTFASVIGFMNMYAFGYYFGDKIDTHRSEFWLMRIIDVKYFDRCKRWMHKYGQAVIVANRFLAGTRSVIAVTAGLAKMRAITTVFSSFLSSISWNFVLLGAGWVVHENWFVIGDYLNIYGWTVLALILLTVGGRFIYVKYLRGAVSRSKKDLKK
ncbi:DedA family protein [Rhodohalobacter sp. 8-1]|uniref:DedA family protein n=1 Tax=Rhodohalobacter sp. 8-1 TaxID=3131972 RepID=UPI0030ED9BB9